MKIAAGDFGDYPLLPAFLTEGFQPLFLAAGHSLAGYVMVGIHADRNILACAKVKD